MIKTAKIKRSDSTPSLDTAFTGAHEPFAQFSLSKYFFVKQPPANLFKKDLILHKKQIKLKFHIKIDKKSKSFKNS